ncbi:MAG: P-II family nitrogen regulator, partial [Schwartzia sp.]|nr:P-II family nitrogen regulator [Schwartzia sp. (in: firmicutes)]
YADFMPTPETPGTTAAPAPVGQTAPPGAPIIRSADGHVLSRVSIVTSRERFDTLKTELEKLGITGMTVTQVLGYGLQKGNSMYRGAHVASRLLPKIKVDLVVSAIPPRDIVEAAKRALYTGHYGDGKIFVSNVDNVIKIRTGEEGFDALQDKEI